VTTTFAGRLVRGWVALYTDGLPDAVRLARRDEIESDLWSQQEEATLTGRSNASLDVEIIARLVLGIAADLTWRLEQGRLADRSIKRSADMGTRIVSLSAMAGAVLWAVATVTWAITVSTNPNIKIWQIPVADITALAGLIALSVALGGLGYILLTRFDDPVGLVALSGMAFGLMSAIGAPEAFIFLPVTSAITVIGLARIHAVHWSVAAIHASAVPGIYLGLAAYNDDSLVGIATVFVLFYAATWIAIGLELLRGLPQPRPVAPSAS